MTSRIIIKSYVVKKKRKRNTQKMVKDRVTKWQKNLPRSIVWTRHTNIINDEPGFYQLKKRKVTLPVLYLFFWYHWRSRELLKLENLPELNWWSFKFGNNIRSSESTVWYAFSFSLNTFWSSKICWLMDLQWYINGCISRWN